MADNRRDPEGLQQDVDRTREELSRTIDEIADRVNPKRVAQRRVELFRENAQHFREGAKLSVNGARGHRSVRALPRAEATYSGATRGDEGYLGTTTYMVRRAKVPLIAGAGVLLVVTTVVVWRLRRR